MPCRCGAHNRAETLSTNRCALKIPGRRLHGSAANVSKRLTGGGRKHLHKGVFQPPPASPTPPPPPADHSRLAATLLYFSVKSVKRLCNRSSLHHRGGLSEERLPGSCTCVCARVCVLQLSPVKTPSKHTLKLICRGRSIRQTRL